MSTNEPTDLNSLIGKYYGPNQIESIDLLDLKTDSGRNIVRVHFKAGSLVLPLMAAIALSTESAIDLTSLRDAKFRLLIAAVVGQIEEFGVSVSEVTPLLGQVAQAINNKMDRAYNYLWFKDDSLFAAGFEPRQESTLAEASLVISEIPKKDG